MSCFSQAGTSFQWNTVSMPEGNGRDKKKYKKFVDRSLDRQNEWNYNLALITFQHLPISLHVTWKQNTYFAASETHYIKMVVLQPAGNHLLLMSLDSPALKTGNNIHWTKSPPQNHPYLLWAKIIPYVKD